MDTNLFLRTHCYLSSILNPDKDLDPKVVFGKIGLTIIDSNPPKKGSKIVQFDLDPNFQYRLAILLKMGIPLLSERDFPKCCLDFVLKSCKVNNWYEVLTKPLPTIWEVDMSSSVANLMTKDEANNYAILLIVTLVEMFDDLVAVIGDISEYKIVIKEDGLAHKKFLDGLPVSKKTLLDVLPAHDPSA